MYTKYCLERKWTQGSLMVHPRNVLSKTLCLLKRLALLKCGHLLCTGTMEKMSLGQNPIQLSIHIVKGENLIR